MDRIEEQAYVYANQSLLLAFVLLSFSFSLSFSFFLSIDHLDAEEKPKKYHTKNGSKRIVVVTSAHVINISSSLQSITFRRTDTSAYKDNNYYANTGVEAGLVDNNSKIMALARGVGSARTRLAQWTTLAMTCCWLCLH